MLTVHKQILAFLFASFVLDQTVASSNATSIGGTVTAWKRRNLDESDVYTTYMEAARCSSIA